VAALVKANDGTNSGVYEYDPFGGTLRATGPMAKENPFRFSTKRTSDLTDFVLYENRVYVPAIGRWASRDPVDELGFMNLEIAVECPNDKLNPYTFVLNDPLQQYDYLGLDEEVWCGCRCGPDVTFAVRLTLWSVYTDYYGPTADRKRACRNLQKDYLGGQGADCWDIHSLVNWSWMKPNDPCHKQCDNTVTYKSQCFYAHQVNYVLYGYASQLCGISHQSAYNWMRKWLKIRALRFPETPQSINQKLEFLTEGYYINIMRSLTQFDPPPCLPSKTWVTITHPSRLGTFDPRDWIWEPIRNRTD
jgi:RHS repeat-associated protein